MKGNIDVKIFEPKKMRVRSVGEKLWMKLPGWSPEQGVHGVTRMRQRVWDPGDP